jgi:hypothetical protein
MSERISFKKALLTAGLIGAVALPAVGCGENNSKKYDKATEAKLKRVIKPTMVNLARRTIMHAETLGHAGLSIEAFNGQATIRGEGKFEGATETIDVETDTFRGINKPNPAAVKSIEIDDESLPFPDTIILAAPHSLTINQHSEGWSATEIIDDKTPHSHGPTVFDSSDSSLFIADNNGNPTNPIRTAKAVVKDTPREFDLAIQTIDMHAAK